LQTFDAVLVGGGPTDDGLLDAARGSGVSVVRSYGMTETCGGCVYDGVPLDPVRLALGADGRIRLSGPVLFDGYAGRPELTANVLRGDWLVTSDLGELDADGRLVVTGRVDDLVKSGGVTVSIAAVERRLATLPGVTEVAVLGAPDAEWGTRVVAVLVGPPDLELDRVRNHVSDVLPRTWAPREVRLVSRIPRLASGKVDRQSLVNALLDGS
jgi:O-succinylbenzoic acid--CoA ligase